MSQDYTWAVDRFENDGYVVVPDVIDQDLVKEARYGGVQWLPLAQISGCPTGTSAQQPDDQRCILGPPDCR